MSTVSGNEQFILPITKNRIKAIDKMEKEFYKIQKEIKDIMAKGPPQKAASKNDKKNEAVDSNEIAYKRQAKYYKKQWLKQKEEIKKISKEVRELRKLSEMLLAKKMSV